MENGKWQQEVIGSLASISAKLDSVVDSQKDHEKRIRFLERGAWVVFGIIAILSVAMKFIK